MQYNGKQPLTRTPTNEKSALKTIKFARFRVTSASTRKWLKHLPNDIQVNLIRPIEKYFVA